MIRTARSSGARLYTPLFILIGLYAGRRKEAILSLRWPQVNLQARTMSFEVSGRRHTNKKRGINPIPPRLLPHLRRARKRGTDLAYILHIDGERHRRHQEGVCRRVQARWHRGRIATHAEAHGSDVAYAGRQPAGFLSTSVETLLRVYRHHLPARGG